MKTLLFYPFAIALIVIIAAGNVTAQALGADYVIKLEI